MCVKLFLASTTVIVVVVVVVTYLSYYVGGPVSPGFSFPGPHANSAITSILSTAAHSNGDCNDDGSDGDDVDDVLLTLAVALVVVVVVVVVGVMADEGGAFLGKVVGTMMTTIEGNTTALHPHSNVSTMVVIITTIIIRGISVGHSW